MNSIDLPIKHKGACSNKFGQEEDVIEDWSYLLPMDDGAGEFKLYYGDGTYDGLTKRDDGIATNADPALVKRLMQQT